MSTRHWRGHAGSLAQAVQVGGVVVEQLAAFAPETSAAISSKGRQIGS
jgi:hypothetical protein